MNRFRLPSLIPDVLPLLETQNRERRDSVDLYERVNYWLSSTTFQNFEPLNEGANARQKMASAWKNWWQANNTKSSDEWFAQAIERDLTFLRGESYLSALRHLETLTGQNFGTQEEWNATKTPAQWKTWWQENKGRRPGQILTSSLATKRGEETYYSGEALGQLSIQCDERDIADLTALYTSYPAKGGYERSYVEAALRYLTNIDSFGVPFVDGAKTQKAVRAWKEFAKQDTL